MMSSHNILAHSLMARDLLALTKPKITIMALLVAAGGLLHARPQQSLWPALFSLVGIAFLVSGSSALNMYLEREHDQKMTRTRTRPLPAGRLNARWAVFIGILCTISSSFILWQSTNVLTLVAGLTSLVLYVWCYTPLKQYSWTALLVGSVPGAMPVMLGYIAITGVIDKKALALFLWAFLWQIPHFLAISLFRESEYTKAGFPVLSRVIGRDLTKCSILLTSWLLVFSTFVLYWADVFGNFLCIGALTVGGWFLLLCHQGYKTMDTDIWARRAFKGSLIYQTILFVLIIISAFV
ncbi:MAG: protoheme IX farnesyltransferase [Myxococcales bacterium]|nr:MAG: protoheme IX farnesyltransferase [Myxococcales bacterium]